MTNHERYRAYFHGEGNYVPMCDNCQFYVHHYIKTPEGRYTTNHEGHCHEPRVKTRMPFDLCNRYEPKEEEATK